MMASLVELERILLVDSMLDNCVVFNVPEHFCEVFDSGVRFVRDVFERVVSLD